jgi:GTP:adenosylcobinamide-phosphate guanylyltransferase
MKKQFRKVDAIIMAGGTGSRMGTNKKMLLEINGNKVVDLIIKQLRHENFEISLCISKNTLFLDNYPGVRIFYGKGNYAEDLKNSISRCQLPVMVISADLVIPPDLLKNFMEKAKMVDSGIATLVVNKELSGISMFFEVPENNSLKYTNINITSKGFFNLNRQNDYKKAIKYYKGNPNF